jgi:hypothetical protein
MLTQGCAALRPGVPIQGFGGDLRSVTVRVRRPAHNAVARFYMRGAVGSLNVSRGGPAAGRPGHAEREFIAAGDPMNAGAISLREEVP